MSFTGWYRLNEDGDPIGCDTMEEYREWDKSPEGEKARRVAEDFVNGIRVSTVFLGLDHSHGYGSPLLWETMTFGGEAWGVETICKRYYSVAEAKRGHAEVVDACARIEPPSRDAVLRRLHETECALRTIWGAMGSIKWTAERGEKVEPSRVTHYEEWMRKFLDSRIEAARAPDGAKHAGDEGFAGLPHEQQPTSVPRAGASDARACTTMVEAETWANETAQAFALNHFHDGRWDGVTRADLVALLLDTLTKGARADARGEA